MEIKITCNKITYNMSLTLICVGFLGVRFEVMVVAGGG